jgi:hypothetical protein
MTTPLERYAELREYVLRRCEKLKHPGDFHFGVGARAFLAVWDYASSEHERAERLARADMHEAWVNCARRRLVNIRERDEARQIARQLLGLARVAQWVWLAVDGKRPETYSPGDVELLAAMKSFDDTREALSPALRRMVEE